MPIQNIIDLFAFFCVLRLFTENGPPLFPKEGRLFVFIVVFRIEASDRKSLVKTRKIHARRGAHFGSN